MLLRMNFAVATLLAFVASSFGQEPFASPRVPGEATDVVVDSTQTLGESTQVFGDSTLLPSCATDACGEFQFSNKSPGWVSGEFLFGWVRQSRLPALVTTSPAGTPEEDAGVLGLATTQTLFSGRVNDDVRGGFRLGGGYTFDMDYGRGVEAGFSFLASQSSISRASSSDNMPILARPYTDVNTGDRAAVLIAFPNSATTGTTTGSVSVKSDSGAFYEAHLDLSERIWSNGFVTLGGLFGYRFSRYDDGLTIRQTLHVDPAILANSQIRAFDNFSTKNQFNGLDMGLRAEMNWQNVTLNVLGKLAAGNVHREVDIQGHQVKTVGTDSFTQAGGVYALISNIGTHRDNEWNVIPELGGTLTWQMRPNTRLRLGYSGTLFKHIATAGKQIDFTVNPELFDADPLAFPRRPQFHMNRSDLWIQTLNLGVDFTF